MININNNIVIISIIVVAVIVIDKSSKTHCKNTHKRALFSLSSVLFDFSRSDLLQSMFFHGYWMCIHSHHVTVTIRIRHG